MVRLFDNIYIESSMVYELLSSMQSIGSFEKIVHNDSKHKKFIPKDLDNWVEMVENNISKDMKKELDIFFNHESYLGCGLIPLIWRNKKYEDIDEFLSFFKNEVTPMKIVKSFFKNGFKKENMDEDYIRQINSLDGAMEFIDKLNLPQEDKWNLLYFFKNPEEAKERLLKLIEYFYKEFFTHEMKKVKKKHLENIEKMKDELCENDYDKITKLLSFDCKFINDIKEFVFVPSYFHGIGLTTSSMDHESFIAIYGINRLDLYLKEEEEEDIIEAFKSISDEKRIKIIRLLNETSYYGYEIGQRLNLSNSTISHHLGILANYKIIKPIRLENKIYYEVNKDKIRNILKKMEELLT